MKKVMKNPSNLTSDEMLPEYDFTGIKGVRGKYYQAYRQGHTVKVYQGDGTISVKYFTLEDGAVMLEPDVRKYFPTSDSVNKALHSLIEIIPNKPGRKSAASKTRKKSIKS